VLVRFVPEHRRWSSRRRTAESDQRKSFQQTGAVLILFATVLFLSQSLLRRVINLEAKSGHRMAIREPILFQFAVRDLRRILRRGHRILMLASLGFIGLNDITKSMPQESTGSLINLVAAVWFVFAGLVNWEKAGL